jgi:hypothetical protein
VERRAEAEEVALSVASKRSIEAAGGQARRVTRSWSDVSEEEHLRDGVQAWHGFLGI